MAENLLDLPAEDALLKAIIRDPSLLETYGENFRPDLFVDPEHLKIAVASIQWRRANSNGDSLALQTHLTALMDEGKLSAESLVTIAKTPAGDAYHWGRLVELRNRRKMLDLSQKMSAQVLSGDMPSVESYKDFLQGMQYIASANPSGIEEKNGPEVVPENFATLAAERPERGPEVIHGILREGAVAALVSGTKCRKTMLILQLAVAVASQGSVQWLGHNVAPGRVLIIDGELTRAAMHFRLRKMFEATGVSKDAFANIDIFTLRGRTKDAPRAMSYARSKPPGYYKLVIIDPQYVFYPDDPRFSENDNAQMRRVYDGLIQFAGDIKAGLVVVHHASKGSQAEKSVADVGAGAGAIARAVDAHLVLRPHAEKEAVVFEGVLRDFPELTPTCWRFVFPSFVEAPELDPSDLASGKRRKSATEEFIAGAKPAKVVWMAESFAEKFLTDEGKTLTRLQAEAGKEGIAERRVKTLLDQAVELGLAYLWPGRSGPGGRPSRYASIPCPITESEGGRELVNSHARPPTPPGGSQANSGAGVFVREYE